MPFTDQLRLRTAIVGCGKVAQTHAMALSELPQSDFVAVSSRTPKSMEPFVEQYGVRTYTDVEEMLEDADVQMVSICTPHPTHPDLAAIAAAHGAHVLVEKPLASDLEGCDRAIDACRQVGVKLGVISQRRLYPPIVRMRRAIDEKRIGEPILATANVFGWRDEAYYAADPWRGTWDAEGGGVMVNQTVHHLDLMQWLMGPIDQLFGQWDNFNHPYVEVEDTAVAVVRFQSGALGSLVLSNSQKPGIHGKIHVHGSTGASIGAQTEGGSPFVQARLIHQALEELAVERPVLVGHSRGGNVALAYAMAYPDQLTGVVTLAAAPYGGEIALHNRLLTVPVLGSLLAHTVYVPFGRGAVEAGLDAAFAPEGPAPPDYVDVYAAYELRPGQLLAHAQDQMRGKAAVDDMARRYQELSVPLVVVHGTADRNVPIEQARRLHRAAPSSRLIAVDGAGHELMFLHPDVVTDAIDLAWGS